MFENNKDVLDWYEKQPRTLTKEFIETIDWQGVKKHPLDARFVPVLTYMRDVETLTDMYHRELDKTPTGKDPIIKRFMDCWGTEELIHGEIINRFLIEAGVDIDEKWQDKMRKEIPAIYKISTRISTMLTNCVGKSFIAAHMTYGAINEMSTLQGYRRLEKMANHPILSKIIRAIMHEEAIHANFYWNIARLELQRSTFAQKISRFVVEKFWVPVGQGAKLEKDTNYTISTLFGGFEGRDWVNKHITGRIQKLPGFDCLNVIDQRVKDICTIQPEYAVN
jgi:hypothetical protein